MKLLEGASREGHRFVMPVAGGNIACYLVGPKANGSRKGTLIGVVATDSEAQRFLQGAMDVSFLEIL